VQEHRPPAKWWQAELWGALALAGTATGALSGAALGYWSARLGIPPVSSEWAGDLSTEAFRAVAGALTGVVPGVWLGVTRASWVVPDETPQGK
jgi:hypothetical protein